MFVFIELFSLLNRKWKDATYLLQIGVQKFNISLYDSYIPENSVRRIPARDDVNDLALTAQFSCV